MGGEEVSVADQRGMLSLAVETTHWLRGFQARVGLRLVHLSPGIVSVWSVRCRFHT